MAAAKLPDTKPYRVTIAGAMYLSPRFQTEFDGEEKVVYVSQLALNGQEIELTDREAHRLKELGAVKPKGEPLSYEEMTTKQLDAAVKAAGITVTSSGADPDSPLHTDKINALRIYDQGRGVAGAAPTVSVPLQAPEVVPPTPELVSAQPFDVETAKKGELEAELARRQEAGETIEVTGTGADGNVLADDLRTALR